MDVISSLTLNYYIFAEDVLNYSARLHEKCVQVENVKHNYRKTGLTASSHIEHITPYIEHTKNQRGNNWPSICPQIYLTLQDTGLVRSSKPTAVWNNYIDPNTLNYDKHPIIHTLWYYSLEHLQSSCPTLNSLIVNVKSHICVVTVACYCSRAACVKAQCVANCCFWLHSKPGTQSLSTFPCT